MDERRFGSRIHTRQIRLNNSGVSRIDDRACMVACLVDFVGNAEPLSPPRTCPYRRLHDYLLAALRYRPVLVECCHDLRRDGGNTRGEQVEHVSLVAIPANNWRRIPYRGRTCLDPRDESLAIVDVVPCRSNDDSVESLTHRGRVARRPDHPFGVDTAIIQGRG